MCFFTAQWLINGPSTRSIRYLMDNLLWVSKIKVPNELLLRYLNFPIQRWERGGRGESARLARIRNWGYLNIRGAFAKISLAWTLADSREAANEAFAIQLHHSLSCLEDIVDAGAMTRSRIEWNLARPAWLAAQFSDIADRADARTEID